MLFLCNSFNKIDSFHSINYWKNGATFGHIIESPVCAYQLSSLMLAQMINLFIWLKLLLNVGCINSTIKWPYYIKSGFGLLQKRRYCSSSLFQRKTYILNKVNAKFWIKLCKENISLTLKYVNYSKQNIISWDIVFDLITNLIMTMAETYYFTVYIDYIFYQWMPYETMI